MVSLWWEGVDSNHRSHWRQIYSLFHLATLEPSHIKLKNLELVTGIEPATCWLQISCSASWATPAFNLVPRGGIEPPTQGFSVPCSTYWATEAYKYLIFWKCLLFTSIFNWRPGRGSNPRPPAWQAGVLTICTTGPNIFNLSGGPSRTRTADQSVMSRPL